MEIIKYLITLFFVSCISAHMPKESKIYVAGHNGMVGRAVVRKLQEQGYNNIITRTSKDLDLRDQKAVEAFFEEEKPEYVFIAAARVGGLKANMDYPAQFLYDNLMIAANIINAAHMYKVNKLIFLGSSCIYPRACAQPIQEDYLLSSGLEKTNEGYAIAKITGLKLCEKYKQQYGDNFISCMPTNLYGPYDNYDYESSHVVPALIRKICEAKEAGAPTVKIWGTGRAKREFLHVDDCANAVIFLMNHYDGQETVNIGTGKDCTIAELAERIKGIVGYRGQFEYDTSKPDGTPRKVLNTDKINQLGWRPHYTFNDGLESAITWYQNNKDNIIERKI